MGRRATDPALAAHSVTQMRAREPPLFQHELDGLCRTHRAHRVATVFVVLYEHGQKLESIVVVRAGSRIVI